MVVPAPFDPGDVNRTTIVGDEMPLTMDTVQEGEHCVTIVRLRISLPSLMVSNRLQLPPSQKVRAF